MTEDEYTEKSVQFAKGVMELAFRMGYVTRDDEIVRCKDCKYSHKCGGDMLMRSASGGYIYCPLGADGYCSMGERTEE